MSVSAIDNKVEDVRVGGGQLVSVITYNKNGITHTTIVYEIVDCDTVTVNGGTVTDCFHTVI